MRPLYFNKYFMNALQIKKFVGTNIMDVFQNML